MNSAALSAYESQMQTYIQTVREEPWQADHRNAMWCRKVEKILLVGIYLYDMLNAADEAWRYAVATGEDVGDLLGEFDSLFDWWLGPCKKVEAWIEECESHGYTVDNAEEFRERHQGAQSAKDDR